MRRFWARGAIALWFVSVGAAHAELDQERYKFAVAEYVETLEDVQKNNPGQVKGILDATFNGYVQCYSHRSYLLRKFPDSNAAPRYKVERERFALNFMYLANAIEDMGLADASDLLDGFRPAVGRSEGHIDAVYQRSKNNGSSVASDKLVQLVDYCRHWARQAQDIEDEVDYKIKLDKILKE